MRYYPLTLFALLIIIFPGALAAADLSAPSSGSLVLTPAAAPAVQPQSAPVQTRQETAASPIVSSSPHVFGEQLFIGNFKSEQFPGFNPNYQISMGDKINLRIWGAVTFDGVLPVDQQGNIFIPTVGPVNVLGVRNGDLNSLILARAQKVFTHNVSLYATLDATQPVKVFVTGYAVRPGLYAGLSSDSVLYYLDKAGGVDPDRGSYIDIKVMRNGQMRKQLSLYDFLLNGNLELVQMADGDTIVVGPRKRTVSISGEVFNAFSFEFESETLAVNDALKLARHKPNATHVSIIRKTGREKSSDYLEIGAVASARLVDGDEMSVLSDRYSGTIQVRVEGAHIGEHSLILPNGATLQKVLERLKSTPRSNMDSIQLFRKSVAQRQKIMLATSLQALEAQALTAKSSTVEEAGLRTQEAELILKFVERARNIEPKGQVVLAGDNQLLAKTLLEDGDLIVIPEKNSLVIVHGEVLFPNAIVFTPDRGPDFYIQQSGGYTQNADSSRILLLKTNGVALNVDASSDQIAAGDELMVLPKIDTKHLEVAKGFSQILFQIAVATRALVGISW